MSGRISVSGLRAKAEGGYWTLHCDIIGALVEAVEAARDVAEGRYFDPVGDAGRERHKAELDRLELALTRFDFEDNR